MATEVKKEDNVILIGKKPLMSYILAVITQFGAGQKEVRIRARGRAISRAVDVANIVRKRYVKDAQIKSITIDSEERDNPQTGKKVNVSTIEIVLSK
ncbi:MAG: DNA-binding protein Alba [Candidatus Aenigmatarchaeota archaeon]